MKESRSGKMTTDEDDSCENSNVHTRKYEAMNGAGGKHTPKTGGNPEMRNESSITDKK